MEKYKVILKKGQTLGYCPSVRTFFRLQNFPFFRNLSSETLFSKRTWQERKNYELYWGETLIHRKSKAC